MVRQFAKIIAVASLLAACSPPEPRGFIIVEAPSHGRFDVYKIASLEPMQFVAEQIGYFNKKISVRTGSYLIQTDCASESVIINPNETVRLVAHKLLFNPPETAEPNDNFTIQCERSQETETRQYLRNRFAIDVLSGKRELLVGMVPLTIDLPANSAKPTTKTFDLGAIAVTSDRESHGNQLFFVSPADGLLAVTASQSFGRKLYLMPGDYRLEVNGTQRQLQVEGGEVRTIKTAYLKVATPPGLDLQRASQVRGSPLLIDINDGHWLSLNQVHAMLPSTVRPRLAGSELTQTKELEAGVLTEYNVRSVRVDLDCSPWEWICLGSRKVFLYETGQPYAFTTGMSDVPILFVGDDVEVGLEGSRDLRYLLPKKESITLKTGEIRVEPKPDHHPSLLTDLLRVEAKRLPAKGHTLDLKTTGSSSVPVITGSYSVVTYTAQIGKDSVRNRYPRSVYVKSKETVTIRPRVYLGEKKLAEYLEKQKQKARPKVARNPFDVYSHAAPGTWR